MARGLKRLCKKQIYRFPPLTYIFRLLKIKLNKNLPQGCVGIKSYKLTLCFVQYWSWIHKHSYYKPACCRRRDSCSPLTKIESSFGATTNFSHCCSSSPSTFSFAGQTIDIITREKLQIAILLKDTKFKPIP